MPSIDQASGTWSKNSIPSRVAGHDLHVSERGQARGAAIAVGMGQQHVPGHRRGAQQRHQQGVGQRQRLPGPGQQHAHAEGADQRGEKVTGGRMVGAIEPTGQQLVQAETEGRAQRQQNGRGKQRPARPHDQQYAQQAKAHRQPQAHD